MLWTDVELYDWHHYSGEFGERVSHVRRVRLVNGTLSGLARMDWYNPDDDGVQYEWTRIAFIKTGAS